MTSLSSVLCPDQVCFFNVVEPTEPIALTSEINVCMVATTSSITFVGVGNSLVTISGIAAPTEDTDVVNKAYADALAGGVTWKTAVQAATTASVDLSTGGLLIVDGVQLTAGDRVLVKDGSTANPLVGSTSVDNGIYIASTGTWVRAPDAGTADQASGSSVFVTAGTNYDDVAFVVPTSGPGPEFDPVDFGSAIEYTQYAASGGSAVGPANSIQVSSDGTGSFVGTSAFVYDQSTTDPTVSIGSDGTSTSGNLDVGTGTSVTEATIDVGAGTGTNTTAILNLGDGTGATTIDAQGTGGLTVTSAGDSTFTSTGGSTTLSTTDPGSDVTLSTSSGSTVINSGDITVGGQGLEGTTLEIQSQDVATTGTESIGYTGFAAPTITPAVGTTATVATTIYIEGAPIATTGVGNVDDLYAMWVDSGVSRFDGDILLYDDLTDTGVTLQQSSSTSATNWTFTLPPDAGTAGYVLQTDGSGESSWVNLGSITNLPEFQLFVGDSGDNPTPSTDDFTYNTAVAGAPVFNVGVDSANTISTLNLAVSTAVANIDAVLNMADGTGSSTIDAQGTGTFTLQASGDAAPIEVSAGDSIVAGTDGGAITMTSGAPAVGSTSAQGGDMNFILGASTASANFAQFDFKLGGNKDTVQADTGNLFLFEGADGNGSGSISNPGFLSRLEDTGEWYASKYRTVSDANFKTNITRISDPLATLRKVEGYTYDWKKSYISRERPKNIGVIAQQLEEAGLGTLVDTDVKGSKTVDYMGLVPVLIEALKEVSKQVDELRGVNREDSSYKYVTKNSVVKSNEKKAITKKAITKKSVAKISKTTKNKSKKVLKL